MRGLWDMYSGEDGNLILKLWGLKEEYLINILELISKYLVCFEEEFGEEYNIEFFSIETVNGEPDCYQFYTSLPYCFYMIFNGDEE